MNRGDFKKKLAEDVHSGLKGFVLFLLGNAKEGPNGTLILPKEITQRLRKISTSTHYKIQTNDKVWADMVVDKVWASMQSIKKKLMPQKADPRVANIKAKFVEYCVDIRGMQAPIIDHGKDGAMIKKRLEDYTEEDVLDCFDWFLKNSDFENFSPTISTALSAAIFNKFLAKRR